MQNKKKIADNLDNLTMAQLRRIKDNQYRSSDCTQDYCPEAVNLRIWHISAKQAERMAREYDRLMTSAAMDALTSEQLDEALERSFELAQSLAASRRQDLSAPSVHNNNFSLRY